MRESGYVPPPQACGWAAVSIRRMSSRSTRFCVPLRLGVDQV